MAKDYARGFYQTKAWRKTQAAYMASQHYVCERCGAVARVVHHIQYITPANIHDPNITLNWENLEALCMDCHSDEHMRVAPCAEGLCFTPDGQLMDQRVPPVMVQVRATGNRQGENRRTL